MSTETAQPYDSRSDTLAHILRVQELISDVKANLSFRAEAHDASKLVEPEKSVFDTCVLKLRTMAYGSDDYKAALAELKPALDHHYEANAHHPEHVKLWRCVLCGGVFDEKSAPASECYEGKPRFCPDCVGGHAVFEAQLVPHISVDGMSLFDLVEMLMDWKAATERMQGGGDILRSLAINTERFHLSPQLARILANTIYEMRWVEPHHRPTP